MFKTLKNLFDTKRRKSWKNKDMKKFVATNSVLTTFKTLSAQKLNAK